MLSKNEINIGIVGLGHRGLSFRELISHTPGCRLHSVCDLLSERVEYARDGYTDVKGYTDLDGMLADKELDGVIVATFDHQHREPTIAVLDAGKHCLLEKPMAQTIEDCLAIMDTASRSKGILIMGLELRNCILFKEMKRLIVDEEIGRPLIGIGIDNVSAGGRYFYHAPRCRRKEFIKSLLLCKATHSLDLMNWFMDGHPQEVVAYAGLDVFGGKELNDKRCRNCSTGNTCHYFYDYHDINHTSVVQDDLCVWAAEITTLDNHQVLIKYDNGARAMFVDAHFTPEYSREFTLIGDEGKMYGFYNNAGDFLIRLQKRHSPEVVERRPRGDGVGGHGGGDEGMLKDFITVIESGDAGKAADLRTGYDTTVLAICAAESADIAKPVVIPTPEFKGKI